MSSMTMAGAIRYRPSRLRALSSSARPLRRRLEGSPGPASRVPASEVTVIGPPEGCDVGGASGGRTRVVGGWGRAVHPPGPTRRSASCRGRRLDRGLHVGQRLLHVLVALDGG